MKVFVNDKEVEIAEKSKLSDLLVVLGIHDTHGVALAINDNIVPKHKWNSTFLDYEMRVLIIRATQGG